MAVDAAAGAAVRPNILRPVTSASQVATLAAPPASAPVASIPSTPMPPPSSTGHRGLYMTLGALIVLAGLVIAGIYIPKKGNAKAGDQVQKTTPAPVPVEPVPAPPVAETPVAVNPAPPQAPVVLAKGGGKIHSRQEGGEGAAAAAAKELEQLQDEIDHLAARVASVNSGLDRLKQQQAAAGYGLRGDMAEHQESMKINLSRAQDAAERGDSAKAKKYADRTTADLEALEKFLGR